MPTTGASRRCASGSSGAWVWNHTSSCPLSGLPGAGAVPRHAGQPRGV
jgi:hypothetical protein